MNYCGLTQMKLNMSFFPRFFFFALPLSWTSSLLFIISFCSIKFCSGRKKLKKGVIGTRGKKERRMIIMISTTREKKPKDNKGEIIYRYKNMGIKYGLIFLPLFFSQGNYLDDKVSAQKKVQLHYWFCFHWLFFFFLSSKSKI